MTHTPGPWIYRDSGIYARDVRPDWTNGDHEFDDERVCIVNLMGGMGGDDTRADALLLTASPDLLAKLSALVDCCDDFLEHGKERHHVALRNAMADAYAVIDQATSAPVPADLAEACAGYRCGDCGREESDCSADPCAAVMADREA